MLDQVLAVAVVLLPTLFAVSIELVSSEIREHLYWRIAVLAFGVSISSLTWFQIARADKKAEADRQKAVVETSERVSAKVSESVSASVTKALAAQYQGTISSLNQEIGSLQNELSGIGKSSQATTKALVRLNAATETAVKGIPRPRRISNEIKPKLIADLAAHKGVVTINFVGGDGESMQFANDWYEVLAQSAWTIPRRPGAVISTDPIIGVRLTIRGDPVAPNEPFTISWRHPASALARGLFAVTSEVTGQRDPNMDENATELDIGVLPRPNK